MSIDEMKHSVRALHRGMAHVVKSKIDRVMRTKRDIANQCNDEIFGFWVITTL